MNIEYFRESLDLLTDCGQKITPEQILLIENSLLLLQDENKFKNIFFWGRVNGIEKDYFIAFGYTKDCLSERRFFYSLNCYQWLMLPEANYKMAEACILCREKFLGDPSVVIGVTLDSNFTIDENQIILATEPETVKLKEEDRLACTVNLITDESAVLPRGGLYKLTNHHVVYNEYFRGLADLEADELGSYQHYRLPVNECSHNMIKRSDYNYAIDFLDTIDDTFPKKVAFTLNLEHNEKVVIIRSCFWHGMSFVHKINSRKHGFVYFGDGKKNLDLLFML